MGLKILLPDINKSEYEYIGENGEIRVGFMAIKNIKRSSTRLIVNERNNNGEYTSLSNFIFRTKLSYKETAPIIMIGGMSSFGETRPTLMRLLSIYIMDFKQNECNLFPNIFQEWESNLRTNREYSHAKISSIEQEVFGSTISHHPLEFFTSLTNNKKVISSKEAENYRGKIVRMVGWFMASKRIRTKKGKIMKFLSLEDLHGTFEAILFPEVYEQFAEQTFSMGPYLVMGKIDSEDEHNIIVSNLAVMSNKEILSITQKDSVENKYYGENEKTYEEEFLIIESLGKEKLRKAYAS